jgi:Peptidase family M28
MMSADDTVLWSATVGDLPSEMSNRVIWFGREAVFIGPDGTTPTPATAEWTWLSRGGPESSLYLVHDRRGFFGVDYPTISRLYENGRYSIVSMDGPMAETIVSPHYTVRPLRVPSTVFRIIEKPATTSPVAPIEKLLRKVSGARLMEVIETLVAFKTRESTSPEFHQALQWAHERFDAMGYRNQHVQEIDVKGRSSANLIVTVEGSERPPRDAVLVTAHLDSTGGKADRPAPGADDNATGVAGVIEIAQCLADRTPECDLLFILFGGEEQGREGSIQYVKGGLMPSRIRGVANMDMIGSHTCTKAPTIMIQGTGPSLPMVNAVTEAAHTYTGLEVQTVTEPEGQAESDNLSFENHSKPAILVIEGNGPGNGRANTVFDTLEHIDPRLVQDIVRANLAFIASLSRVRL